MRIALTLILTLLNVAFIPTAFANPFWQAHTAGLPTGFYTGLNLGGQFGRSSDKTGDFGYNADNETWRYDESGFNMGGAMGYGYCLHGVIIGPEIELGYLGLQGHGAQPDSPGLDTVGKSNGNFYTTFRGRAGMNYYDYLVYLTGGAIGVNYTTQVNDHCNIAPCGGNTIHAKKTDFVWGYTVGGGIERLFGKNWSVKVECLYFNLGNQNFSGTTSFGNTYDWSGKTSGYIIRGGINYYLF